LLVAEVVNWWAEAFRAGETVAATVVVAIISYKAALKGAERGAHAQAALAEEVARETRVRERFERALEPVATVLFKAQDAIDEAIDLSPSSGTVGNEVNPLIRAVTSELRDVRSVIGNSKGLVPRSMLEAFAECDVDDLWRRWDAIDRGTPSVNEALPLAHEIVEKIRTLRRRVQDYVR
jgi:hypothetical protein